MNPFRRSLILVTTLALVPLAGVASAGQARPRSAPPTQGSSSSGSSSSSSSSEQQGRSRTQAQPRERESAPQQQSQRPQEQTRERQQQPQQSQRQEQQREREQVQQQREREQSQRQQNNQYDARQNNDRNDNSRQAIPAPRDRYIDTNRDGRNDNRDSRILGPQDRRDIERRNDNRYDGRYDRYDNRYSSYSPYRYDGPRIVFAPRQSVRFSRPWFSFRPLIRLPFGLTLGYTTPFPSWYRPYIVGRPGYQAPYMPYGGVTFDIEPRDAEVWIDGEYIGRASDYSYNDPPLTLVAGSHYVELRSRYGRPLAFDITVIPGQVIPYQGTLPYYR